MLPIVILVLLLAPGSARAAEPAAGVLSAEEVLARHAGAIGAPGVIAATERLRFLGRAQALGLPGTVESFVEGPGNMVQRLDLGVVAITTGLSGGQDAWTVNPNGAVRGLDGEERGAVLTEAWFASLAYVGALGDGAGGSQLVELVPNGSDTLHLAVTPPGGNRRLLALDPATFRLLESRDVQDTDTITTFYEDYREVDGLTLPFRTRQTTGDPTHDVVIELSQIERNGPSRQAATTRPEESAGDIRLDGEAGSDGIPVTLQGAHLMTRVMVNGRGPYSFFLDTGAGASCLDERLAGELALPRAGAVEAQGVGGSVTVAYVRVDSIGIGPVTLLGQRLVTIPFGEIPGVGSMGFDGILGYDFFSRFVVKLDYAAGRMSLALRGDFVPPPGATALPITLEGNVPAVAGMVNGRHGGNFRIDTGSGSTLDLHGPFVARHHLIRNASRVAHQPFSGVGGSVLGVVARLDSFAIGPFVITEPIVGLSEVTEGVFASSSYAGNIGGGLLRRFTVTLDYEGRTIYLEPNEDFGQPEVFNRSGLSCWLDAGTCHAVYVEEQSPAWRAGVRADDRILAFNGRVVGEWTQEEITSLLRRPPGTPISIRFTNGSAARSAVFRLEDLL